MELKKLLYLDKMLMLIIIKEKEFLDLINEISKIKKLKELDIPLLIQLILQKI